MAEATTQPLVLEWTDSFQQLIIKTSFSTTGDVTEIKEKCAKHTDGEYQSDITREAVVSTRCIHVPLGPFKGRELVLFGDIEPDTAVCSVETCSMQDDQGDEPSSNEWRIVFQWRFRKLPPRQWPCLLEDESAVMENSNIVVDKSWSLWASVPSYVGTGARPHHKTEARKKVDLNQQSEAPNDTDSNNDDYNETNESETGVDTDEDEEQESDNHNQWIIVIEDENSFGVPFPPITRHDLVLPAVAEELTLNLRAISEGPETQALEALNILKEELKTVFLRHLTLAQRLLTLMTIWNNVGTKMKAATFDRFFEAFQDQPNLGADAITSVTFEPHYLTEKSVACWKTLVKVMVMAAKQDYRGTGALLGDIMQLLPDAEKSIVFSAFR